MLAFFIGGYMILNLYVVNDGDNVINKNKTNKTSITINLKRDVNISSPSIILLDDATVNHSDFNYAEIEELGRFYFVDNIQRLNNKMIQMDLVCDVLETYKADILASRARFYRNIKTGDYYAGVLDQSTIKTVTKHMGTVTLGSNESMILTSVGEI